MLKLDEFYHYRYHSGMKLSEKYAKIEVSVIIKNHLTLVHKNNIK